MQFHPNIELTLKKTEFTKTELDIIYSMFSNPIIVKYLDSLANDLVLDHANLPVDPSDNNLLGKALMQAFVKGNLNMVQTLLKIHKEPKPATQTNQQGVANATSPAR